jgi:hypothetical protein
MAVSLASNALVSEAEIMVYFSVTASNDLLKTMINAASSKMATFCGRDFIKTDHTEYRNGYAENEMYLNHWPILDATDGTILAPITSPVVYFDDDNDGVWQAASTYGMTLAWDKPTGLIYFLGGQCFHAGRRNVKIVYPAGYLTVEAVPANLKDACLKLAALAKKQIDTQSIGMNSVSAFGETTNFSFDKIPDDVLAVLNSYRRPSLCRT